MDRLSQLRDKAGGASDSTLDTSSPPSEAYITANLSTSKYYSLSEVDSTFDISTIKDDISSIKDVSIPNASTESEGTMTNADELITNLSPIRKKSDIIDSYKIDTQIEAANILSGGVAIFDDNDNSYDGDELVIDDNVEDDKSDAKQNDNLQQFKTGEQIESSLINEEMDIGSKDSEVVLQIDGKNVDAIDIGNGLYLYRKAGQEELAAVQIIDDERQQPSFKFLKVRENSEGNLEVYEEIEIEVPKEVPAKDGKLADKNTSHVPIKDINRVITESTCSKVSDVRNPKKELTATIIEAEVENKETSPPSKSEVNLNGKMMKFNESRKSPVIGTYTPMTYHSTPNKEGIPLTKIMVDQQLHTNRHSDISNIKKTIEVHTENCKLKSTDKNKEIDDNKVNDLNNTVKEAPTVEPSNKNKIVKENDSRLVDIKENSDVVSNTITESKIIDENKNNPLQLEIVTASTDNNSTTEKTEVILHIDDNNLITAHEAQFEDNVQVVNIEKSKKIVQVKNTDEDIMQVQKNESEKNTVRVENIVEKKDELVMLIDNIEEKIDKKVLPIEDTGKSVIENVDLIENSKEKQEKVEIEQVISINTDKLEKSVITTEIPYSTDIEEEKHECEVVPMEIDTCIESSIQIADTSADNIKSAADSGIQSEQNVKNIGNTHIQKLNKQIIIDENVNVSLIKDHVEGQKEELIQNDKTLNSSKHDLQHTPNVGEGNEKTEDVTTKNNKSELKLEGPNVCNTENQSESKEDILQIELMAKKGDELTCVNSKESQVPFISAPNQEEPINKTRRHLEVNVAQQGNINKSSLNISKNQLSQVVDTKQDAIKCLDLKESALREDPFIHSAHISKPAVLGQNQRHSEITIVKPIMPGSSGNSTLKNLNPANEIEIQSIDSNVLQASPRKETTKDIQIIAISPVAKVKKSQSELSTIKDKNIPDKTHTTFDVKPSPIIQIDNKKDLKLSGPITKEKSLITKNIEINKVPKPQPNKSNLADKEGICSTSKIVIQNVKNPTELKEKNDIFKVAESKPINNNNAAVPFGKWTEANRQEFLNKFKTKTLVTSSSSNQLKNSNDLNRRDVLKKIDSQRQSNNALSKTQEPNKIISKPDTAAFTNKPNPNIKESSSASKTLKGDVHEIKLKAVSPKDSATIDTVPKIHSKSSHTTNVTNLSRNEVSQRTGVVQNLIDKTIEGMIHRNIPSLKVQDDKKQSVKDVSASLPVKLQQSCQSMEQGSLDEIEMKMNELHGIPFIERPPHELPQVNKSETKSYSKAEKEKLPITSKTKIPNLLPFPNKNQQKVISESVIEVDSEDEVIEHEPITGDIDMNKKTQVDKPLVKELLPAKNQTSKSVKPQIQDKFTIDNAKREAIITEKDFDKFARRNSITYENRITVNFDGKETPNVIQTVVEKDLSPKNLTKKEHGHTDQKIKATKYQNVCTNTQPIKTHPPNKFISGHDEASNRNQSKLQKAYHSVLTAKRQLAAESPITIIEDKPVKVVFMESVDYIPSQLNVQGQDLTPTKKNVPDADITVSACGSLDSDIMDTVDDLKSQDDIKTKTKHQRKQVLTPVDAPELELIEPSDLGIEVSPKKKRRSDEDSRDKNLKYPTRKKLYLLSSSVVSEEKSVNPMETEKKILKQSINNTDNCIAHKNPVSALDSLVKAAELIETQTDNITTNIVINPDSQSSTPVKRGRGRPRKYPLTPDGLVDKSKVTAVSPQKKPRLTDAQAPKRHISTDDSDSDSGIIKENWTMGKINENIVCPICNKLFRTENVVFKHVKHCTGPSPSRSDSDKRSPRRMRISQDFDTKSQTSKSDDMDDDKPLITRIDTFKKRNSKDSISKVKPEENDDIIVIEDTPIKEKPEKEKKVEIRKHESRKPKSKIPQKNDLVCEFCGKIFRQLSYLISHKLQHKKIEKTGPKKVSKDSSVPTKSVYSCEVCKKEFRKLHHLVQHRIIHNPSTVTSKSSRKSSSEQSDGKIDKELISQKQGEDQSAGFRCEPCDKSFRKLHHLVEHRETHDGINRQKTSTSPTIKEEKFVEKSVVLHHCDICKKSFKKLQDLNDHKEEHAETSSEKTVTVTDIIHECAICYMVFPNEHSLNKHTIICQRKKRQSKQQKPANDSEGVDEIKSENEENPLSEKQVENVDSPASLFEDIIEDEEKDIVAEKVESFEDKDITTITKELDTPKENREEFNNEQNDSVQNIQHKVSKDEENEPDKSHETPKKKALVKEKSSSVSKRLKTTTTSKQVTVAAKPATESSDDDEIRYMLNPNFKTEDVTVEKIFMKVKAKKRNSLQIERPNSKELVKRRISLQHPPKIPRLKPKAIEPTTTVKKAMKPILEPSTSTDSDDSETTKYSFPVTIPVKSSTKTVQTRTPKKSERKTPKKSLVDKRKSLSAIAKRKSMGNTATAKPKASPLKQAKKRILSVEHRCDCGQLFSSAALLSRHTSLAHTPPRIRRKRSPPPKPKQTTATRKLNASNTSPGNSKVEKSEAHSSVKPRRSTAHRGVPVPEKMRKLMLNNK